MSKLKEKFYSGCLDIGFYACGYVGWILGSFLKKDVKLTGAEELIDNQSDTPKAPFFFARFPDQTNPYFSKHHTRT